MAPLERGAPGIQGALLCRTRAIDDAVKAGIGAGRSEAFRRSASRRPEPWLFGIEPARLGAFLGERGLTLREDIGAEEHLARFVRPPACEQWTGAKGRQ